MTIWLDRLLIEAIQSEHLALFGGAPGLRDGGLLESALARPQNHALYGDPALCELAALYAIAIARNHPFVDGNKRTAYVALELFLALNGLLFPVSDAEAVVVMLDMAAGEMTDAEFIAWVCEHATPGPAAAADPAG